MKASRLVIRRTVAQAMCDAGAIDLNGTVAKSSRAVKVGDLLTIRRGERRSVFKIIAIPGSKQVSKPAATELYELVADESVEDLLAAE